MYYESIQHTGVEVDSAEAAGERIRTHDVTSNTALIWRNSRGERIAVVGDGGLDSPFFEVAVINLDLDRQIESITFGWIKPEEYGRELKDCEDDAPLSDRPARLPLDGSREDSPCAFTCSCCGEGFRSTINEQRRFDQDEGYGHCPSCIQQFNLTAA